jgi:tRNA 2-thiocytidine biosynthesis protein TtcA
MAYCKEADIMRFAQIQGYPIIPCNLCGSQENLQRQNIKAMCQEWDKQFPGRVESIFRSMANVSLSQLADRDNFDFDALRVSGIPAVNIEPDNEYSPLAFTTVNTWEPNSDQ